MGIPFNAEDQQFVNLYGASVSEFADLMRKYFLISCGTGRAAEEAKAILRRAANEASLNLGAVSAGYVPRRMKGAMALALEQLKAGEELSFGGIDFDLLQSLTAANLATLDSANDGPQRLLGNGIREAQALIPASSINAQGALTESLVQGIFRQETTEKLQKRIMADLGLNDGDTIALENGTNWDASAYARLIARTMPAEAANLQKESSARNGGYDYILFDEHDGVEEDDIWCYTLQGKVFALDKDNELGFPTVPADAGMPPWHPNCSHSFSIFQPKFEKSSTIDKYLAMHSR